MRADAPVSDAVGRLADSHVGGLAVLDPHGRLVGVVSASDILDAESESEDEEARARFLTTASQLDQLPQGDLPEFAFVGRSNAGKSTAINALAQRRQLAFASKTPGRTQHINLFALGPKDQPDAYLADLPGYGYAAVPRQEKLRWQQVMANYLVTRANLRAVVLLCDPRQGLTELDDILLEVIRPRVEQGLKFLLLLTKADKLSRGEALKRRRQIASLLELGEGEPLILFSAQTGDGKTELWKVIGIVLRGGGEPASGPALG